MTGWWLRTVRAAWDRIDRWRGQRIDPNFDGFAWFDEMRHQQDQPLGPRETPKRPGHRYVGRHRAIPNDPVRRPS